MWKNYFIWRKFTHSWNCSFFCMLLVMFSLKTEHVCITAVPLMIWQTCFLLMIFMCCELSEISLSLNYLFCCCNPHIFFKEVSCMQVGLSLDAMVVIILFRFSSVSKNSLCRNLCCKLMLSIFCTYCYAFVWVCSILISCCLLFLSRWISPFFFFKLNNYCSLEGVISLEELVFCFRVFYNAPTCKQNRSDWCNCHGCPFWFWSCKLAIQLFISLHQVSKTLKWLMHLHGYFCPLYIKF